MNRTSDFAAALTAATLVHAGAVAAADAQTAPQPFHQCVHPFGFAVGIIANPTGATQLTVPPGMRLIARHASFIAESSHSAPAFARLIVQDASSATLAQHVIPIASFITQTKLSALWVGSIAVDLIIDQPAKLAVVLDIENPPANLSSSNICVSGELVPLPTTLTVGGQ